ncbi:MAG TPA: heme exporter protein CcmB [Candidatus Polarisedimenticolia bacterium]|nr:heme exporter protein CcmB [Candidatus Polarisedimenticolia bacterium]
MSLPASSSPAARAALNPGVLPGAGREARKAVLVCAKDLRIEWRNLDNLPAMFFFSLLILVIFNFAFDFASSDFRILAPGVLWVAFTFAGVLSFGHSFDLERDADCIQGLRIAPIDPGSLYLGKMMANGVSMLLVELVVLPLSALLFGADLLPVAAPLGAVVLAHTVGFAAVGTLFGAMTARTRRGDVLLPILLFSVSVPLMISAVKSTSALLSEGTLRGEAATWLTMACIFDVVFVTAAYLTFEYVLEE